MHSSPQNKVHMEKALNCLRIYDPSDSSGQTTISTMMSNLIYDFLNGLKASPFVKFIPKLDMS